MSVQTLKITRLWETGLSEARVVTDDSIEYPVNAEVFMEIDHEATEADAIAELAGRGCYQSWHKPNPKTERNADYLSHILDVGHYSLFAHAQVGYYIEGVSRSLTHELIRHRWVSFSQLSQRYVKIDENELDYVVPPLFRGDQLSEHEVGLAAGDAVRHYHKLVRAWEDRRAWEVEHHGSSTLTAKRIREAARAVLPNMTETKIAASTNLRGWRDMLAQRLPEGADAEIRELAHLLLADLKQYAPSTFQDIEP